jgi:uncharacterized membrane protein
VSPARRRYIDWARAIAILVMIEAHTLDAWTRPADRHGPAFRNLTVLGGFAAPLFLWLAGIAVVLSAERTARRIGDRRTAASFVCRRGLEIFILAFLFRLQAFIVSPGNAPVMLFRVDILNIMGPAIVAAGVLWGITRGTGTMIACGTAAIAVAMATPLVRAAGWVTALPIWVQWYLRPSGDYTLFTVFPWAGFLFAGSAVGVLIAPAHDSRTERRLQATLAALGAALIVGGFWMASLPTIYRESSFWTSSPTFFSIRLGVMMLWLPMVYAARAPRPKLVVRLLDPRRARVWLPDVAAPASPVLVANGGCVLDLLRRDVRGRGDAGPGRLRLARRAGPPVEPATAQLDYIGSLDLLFSGF